MVVPDFVFGHETADALVVADACDGDFDVSLVDCGFSYPAVNYVGWAVVECGAVPVAISLGVPSPFDRGF